jgi:ABC-type lipoprotein release transport system permease subunit
MTQRSPKRSSAGVSMPAETEIVFVVDVSSFTEKGFIGTSRFEGQPMAIDFDDGDQGIFLSHEMAGRLGVRKGSRVSALVEADKTQAAQMAVAAVGRAVRISDAKVYYAIGKEGGAVIRIRKS